MSLPLSLISQESVPLSLVSQESVPLTLAIHLVLGHLESARHSLDSPECVLLILSSQESLPLTLGWYESVFPYFGTQESVPLSQHTVHIIWVFTS